MKTSAFNHLAAHAAAIAAQIIWASWNVISVSLRHAGSDPVVFAFYRELLCAVLLCVAARVRRRPPALKLADAALLVPCGGCLASFQLLYLFGVGGVDANTAGLSNLLIPVLALAASALLGWEPLPLCRGSPRALRASYAKLAGVGCSCAGCAILVLKPDAPLASPSLGGYAAGCLCLLLSAAGAVAFTLLQKPLLHRFAELDVLAGCYAVAALVAAAICAVWQRVARPAALTLGRDELGALAYAVGLVGIVAYSAFTFANSRLPASLLTLYGILQPLCTSCLAFALLGETPNRAVLLGGPLIVLGLCIATLASGKPPPRRALEAALNESLLTTER